MLDYPERTKSYFICGTPDAGESERWQERLNAAGIRFKLVQGCYKGTPEHSFVISLDAFTATRETGILAGQESVLVIGPKPFNGDRPATLRFLDASVPPIDLGTFQVWEGDGVPPVDAWTYDPLSETYFICA